MKSILLLLLVVGAFYGVRQGWFEVNWPLLQNDVQTWLDGFNDAGPPE